MRRGSERASRLPDSRGASQAGVLRATGRMVQPERARFRGALPVRATALEMLAGVGLDVLIGDPRWLPHPVRGFGWLAVRLESLCRSTGLPARVAGGIFWVSAVSLAG